MNDYALGQAVAHLESAEKLLCTSLKKSLAKKENNHKMLVWAIGELNTMIAELKAK